MKIDQMISSIVILIQTRSNEDFHGKTLL
jgi:hypothetical protein